MTDRDQEDRQYMQMALDMAKLGRGYTNPNPMVGAVIVKEGKVIAKGYHHCCGQGHAEVEAFKDAGDQDVTGATIYVTLEPCPMCAGAIINARIPRLVFGASDPKAGSCGSLVDLFSLPYNHHPAVVSGVLAQEAAELLREFFRGLRSAGRRSAAQAAAGPLLSSEKKVGKDSQGAAPP